MQEKQEKKLPREEASAPIPQPRREGPAFRALRAEGIDVTLREAGFEIRQPGCSACLAMNDDRVGEGKYAVSTSNRNFEGRQGRGARTILASPLVAAAAAITGTIADPRELMTV